MRPIIVLYACREQRSVSRLGLSRTQKKRLGVYALALLFRFRHSRCRDMPRHLKPKAAVLHVFQVFS